MKMAVESHSHQQKPHAAEPLDHSTSLELRFTPQPPGRENLARLAGFNLDRPAHVDRLTDLLSNLPDWQRLARPRGVYRLLKVATLEAHRLKLEDNATYRGAIGQFLAHVQWVAPFVVTIGSALERLARRRMQAGKLLEGTVIDALASELVENAADQLQQRVREWAHDRDLEITPRYSPGYCGLDMSSQMTLFQQIDAARINVHLTGSHLMLPIKSVSGLIGIGPADRVSPEGYPCSRCSHPDCMMRRAPSELPEQ
jgi:hypothetical protein